MISEQVILVDETDHAIGVADKLDAHKTGQLHRAVSVLVFNTEGELLIQKRADDKYHGGGLWTNTCCTHPRLDETNEACAHRRLMEEMGFDTMLEEKFSFVYREPVENQLIENEFDHVFVGSFSGAVRPDAAEVEDHRFVAMDDIARMSEQHPEQYSVWFRIILDKYREHLARMEHRTLRAVGV